MQEKRLPAVGITEGAGRLVGLRHAGKHRRDDDGPGGISQAPGWDFLATLRRHGHPPEPKRPRGRCWRTQAGRAVRLPRHLLLDLAPRRPLVYLVTTQYRRAAWTGLYSTITVFGGTGFLGRQIVRRLADGGADVRVAVRHPERASFLAKAGKAGQITTVYADVWTEASVGPAVNGAEAVVNTVGHYVERGKATFEAIHGQGAMHVARASAMAGVRRLVHISGIGADPGSELPYVRARAVGERLIREAFPGAPSSSARA